MMHRILLNLLLSLLIAMLPIQASATHTSEVPAAVATQMQADMAEAGRLFEAGDLDGAARIMGRMQAGIASGLTGAAGAVQLTASGARALAKIARKPVVFRELQGVGAAVTNADLPTGFTRVAHPNGDIVIMAPDGRVYASVDEISNASRYVDILSLEARQHILYGDGPGSGGHLWPGQPGKTPFPESWGADRIIHVIGDITTSPNTHWYAQTGNGGLYTRAGKPARWVSYETVDNVRIRVVYEPATGRVVTGFPDSAPIPKLVPIQ